MTRKKWTKLRRQRPELFSILPAFEAWTPQERNLMRTVSKRLAVARMSAFRLSQAGVVLAQTRESLVKDFKR